MSEADSGWAWQERPFAALFQSQLTDGVVRQLVATGECGLTPYQASCRHHLPFLRALAAHLGEESCRIT